MNPAKSFAIKTEVFEGPLDLLLDLIEKRKLLINDISLAAVTDDYMAYVSSLEDSRMRDTAQFVLIAATLLLIKSKSLLPVLALTEEEEANIEDLSEKLKLYKIYRDASAALRTIFGTHILYERPYKADATPVFMPDSFTTREGIMSAMQAVLVNLPKKPVLAARVSVKKVISLEEMMKSLEKRITDQFKVSFKSLAQGGERSHVIVSFLAVLELVKQGIVMAEQEARFADFEIKREGGASATPRYE